jgi:Ca-activated chloride channel family protein
VVSLPIILIAIGIAALAGLAEWLHARRSRRVAGLLLGSHGGTVIARVAPWLRIAGTGVLAWGVVTLITIDGAPRSRLDQGKPLQHVLICLDVSPSMYVADAGPDGRQARGKRAREVLQSVFDRLDMTKTRVSVVAFYTSAKPVVVDTFDLNVVANILEDLPLEHAFKEGQTKMYDGIREAARIAETWPPGSATLIVVSDGDTLPDSGAPTMPRSIIDSLVVGVGNPYRGTQIGGRSSRQDAGSLKQLAARLRGTYHDGNAHHLPTSVLTSLRMLSTEADQRPALRTVALVACGVGGLFVAGVSPLLAVLGLPRAMRREERAWLERASTMESDGSSMQNGRNKGEQPTVSGRLGQSLAGAST